MPSFKANSLETWMERNHLNTMTLTLASATKLALVVDHAFSGTSHFAFQVQLDLTHLHGEVKSLIVART